MATQISYRVEFIGPIWMPNVTCGADRRYRRDAYPLTASRVNWNDRQAELDAIERVLLLYDSGDFQGIDDYQIERCVIVKRPDGAGGTITQHTTTVIRPWESDDSEGVYLDCISENC